MKRIFGTEGLPECDPNDTECNETLQKMKKKRTKNKIIAVGVMLLVIGGVITGMLLMTSNETTLTAIDDLTIDYYDSSETLFESDDVNGSVILTLYDYDELMNAYITLFEEMRDWFYNETGESTTENFMKTAESNVSLQTIENPTKVTLISNCTDGSFDVDGEKLEKKDYIIGEINFTQLNDGEESNVLLTKLIANEDSEYLALPMTTTFSDPDNESDSETFETFQAGMVYSLLLTALYVGFGGEANTTYSEVLIEPFLESLREYDTIDSPLIIDGAIENTIEITNVSFDSDDLLTVSFDMNGKEETVTNDIGTIL